VTGHLQVLVKGNAFYYKKLNMKERPTQAICN
jgi:hypothetical protein